MRKFTRLPSPDFLRLNWEKWGEKWAKRKEKNSSAVFNWRQIDTEKVNHLLLIPLKEQTNAHCSFCDSYPVSPPGIDTIEHFKPKSQFPLLAYQWENLYYCCNYCQKKGEDFSDKLLCPDAEDYCFDRYFIWDYTTGELNPNPTASKSDREKASITIELYSLNIDHPLYRRMQRRRYQSYKDTSELAHWPYRDFLV